MFKSKKDTHGNTQQQPKREQRELYSGDQQRRVSSVLGPKPSKHTLLDRWRKQRSDKRK
jgi:hypothetical protein